MGGRRKGRMFYVASSKDITTHRKLLEIRISN